MEPKIIDDPNAPKGAISAAFSFRKHFNILKQIGQPTTNIITKPISPEEEAFKDWLLKNGTVLGKISYPAYFSETTNIVYPGVIATEDISKHEVINKDHIGSY